MTGDSTIIVQTAFLRCPIQHADAVSDALARVAAVALRDEPETLDYIVLRTSAVGGTVCFTTVETFNGQEGMEVHNTSEAVAAFFDETQAILSCPVNVVVNTVVPPAHNQTNT